MVVDRPPTDPMAHVQDAAEHFTARAQHYERSSRWCTDDNLMMLMTAVATPRPEDRMLDVACGTGLIAKGFRSRVSSIAGVDLTAAMAAQASPWLDQLIIGSAETLPFVSNSFDLTVCRQGIQFMEAPKAVSEMARVTTTGGRLLLVNLCAFDHADLDEYGEILKLRNPARRNFFVPNDLTQLLRDAGCTQLQLHFHESEEDVDVWSDNGAISEQSRTRIRALYLNSSRRFQHRHRIRLLPNGHIVDRMLFAIALGIA